MNLIKIDPQNRTVEYVESTGTLEDMYRLIDCRMIDVCARQRNGDALTMGAIKKQYKNRHGLAVWFLSE